MTKIEELEAIDPISIVFEEELDRSAAYDRGKLIGKEEF